MYNEGTDDVTQLANRLLEEAIDANNTEYCNFEEEEMKKAIRMVARRHKNDMNLYQTRNTSGHNLVSLYGQQQITRDDEDSMNYLREQECFFEDVDPDGYNTCIRLLQLENERYQNRKRFNTNRGYSSRRASRGGSHAGRLRIL